MPAGGNQHQSNTTDVYDTPAEVCPVAQSFYSPRDGYITGVELYFFRKHPFVGVEIQLRDMTNGYPGKTILGKVFVPPAKINISVNSNNATAATTIFFDNPIWVRRGVDYCLVILSDNNFNKIWISRVGGTDITTGYYVAGQADNGVYFKSANNSTWTADQYVDMKYKVLYAKFTSQVGTLKFNKMRGVIAGGLVLRSWFNLPSGSELRWYYSFDGVNYKYISANNLVKFDSIRRGIHLKADFIGVLDRNGDIISPSINKWASLPFGYALRGKNVPWDYPNAIEVNSISKNSILSTDGYSEIRVVTDEYRPANAFVELYVSTDDGDTWLRMPNSPDDISAGIRDYKSVYKGGLIYEVTRMMTFNPVLEPVFGASSGNPVASSGGSFVAGDYYIAYSFYNLFGESNISDPFPVSGVTSSQKITFKLADGNNWPPSYPENPSTVTGFNVYVGLTPTTLNQVVATGTVAAGATVTVLSNAAIIPAVPYPQYNKSVPTNFRTRTRLITKRFGYYIDNPSAPLQGFSYSSGSGATIPSASNYSIVYTWMSDRDLSETSASPSLDGTAGKTWANPGGSGNDEAITLTSLPAFPDRAIGMYIYIKEQGDAGTERRVNVTVTRNGVPTSVPFIVETDVGPFKITSYPSTPPYVNPFISNQTTPIAAKGSQVHNLRVISHDEVI